MEVIVLARELIKPSSPTPPHLRRINLSFLDQMAPPIFMPRILFYPSQDNPPESQTQKSDLLKKSLSEALTRFYPLAGRLSGNTFIDCNDEGVPFSKALVKCPFSQVVNQVDPCELNKLLPCEVNYLWDFLLAIQFNIFECGGIAIGICISHKFADAPSIVSFTNFWAAMACGERNLVSPLFESSMIFPPKDISAFYDATTGLSKGKKIVTKTFVFGAFAINTLKIKYSTSANSDNPLSPTRVEALSAFIWSRYTAAIEEKTDPTTLYGIVHSVNLRSRMNPPIPESHFGNIYHHAISLPIMNKREEGYGLVSQIRNSVRGINSEYIAKIQEANELFLMMLKMQVSEMAKLENVVSFTFSSLLRLPIYEADFGWGNPVWATSASLEFKNLALFMPTRFGDGVEVWVNMEEDDMAKFEVDSELLSFVSKNL